MRYYPEIKWSKKSWTHNIFRFYEMIFGRKFGIRAESRSSYSNGQILYEVYTFEAACALLETYIRRKLKFKIVKVYIPVLAISGFPNLQQQPYLFAIALDTTTTGAQTTASPISWSHTVTGSNPFIAMGFGLRGSTNPTITGCTYNSVTATKARADISSGTVSGAAETSVWFKGNPSTGANSVSATFTGVGTNGATGGAVSYSGAQSTNTADAVGGTNFTAVGAKSFNVTTVANNCWVFSVAVVAGGTTPNYTTPTQTSRWSITHFGNANSFVGQDTNTPKTPAGSVSSGWTAAGTSSSNYCGCLTGASFAPASVLSTNSNMFLVM